MNGALDGSSRGRTFGRPMSASGHVGLVDRALILEHASTDRMICERLENLTYLLTYMQTNYANY